MTKIIFESNVPISQEFGDVYFSKEGGIEETIYVFWEGNDMPAKLSEKRENPLSIGELGFGTGLNFFVSLDLWRKEKNPPHLSFHTLEKYPLGESILTTMQNNFPQISSWEKPVLESYLNHLEQKAESNGQSTWQWKITHPNETSFFTLNLYLGDASEVLKSWNLKIDVWYLDGFAPSKNPEMWSEEIFAEIKNKSNKGASFSTFTAAGFVRRGLENQGFSVEKKKGFGKKREMLVGKYEPKN